MPEPKKPNPNLEALEERISPGRSFIIDLLMQLMGSGLPVTGVERLNLPGGMSIYQPTRDLESLDDYRTSLIGRLLIAGNPGNSGVPPGDIRAYQALQRGMTLRERDQLGRAAFMVDQLMQRLEEIERRTGGRASGKPST